jgi:hypothetical protein
MARHPVLITLTLSAPATEPPSNPPPQSLRRARSAENMWQQKYPSLVPVGIEAPHNIQIWRHSPL